MQPLKVSGNADEMPEFTIDEICSLTGVPKRTVRYYIQIGLLGRPEGETRAARYGNQHLEALLTIRRWTESGLSLERIRELMGAAEAPVPPRPRRYGEVEVWSTVPLADGVEVSINPERSNLTPEQARQFLADVMSAFEKYQHPDKQQ